jgi:RNA polymerase sigma-70 factor (ECF subfamily)
MIDEHREREIACGLREGKPEAWHALYDEFAKPIWEAVARQVGPHESDVADIVQETFMAAVRGARQFDGSLGTLGAWLFGIARNHVALHFRKKTRHDRVKREVQANFSLGGQLLSWLQDQQAEAGSALESAELAVVVRSALTALPCDYETLLVAKYVDDVSVDELAQADRSTPVAIRSKLARARQAFRETFAKTSGCSVGNKEGVR